MSCFVRQYHTLIVSALGFMGVMATLVMNAYLSRRQHLRKIEHDRKVLRLALRAELKMLRASCRDRIEMLDEGPTSPTQFALLPLNTMTAV